MSVQETTIRVQNLPIRLGQFLKLTDQVQDGFEAKMRIQNGEVLVNNLTEIRRGRQLHHHDRITFAKRVWIVSRD
jgi:ribosome-associated protein